ncbi:MAG: type II 3-dehydroquinate dehydratase [Clostridia bacterium]|nr:type II 3-dehydroquinate dehydratase [Clostridia bacterium]
MKIMVINGPNLNMLGIREPDIYGKETYYSLIKKIHDHADEAGVEVKCFQSNHEGDLVDFIQTAHGKYDGIVINPGAYTHTSIALFDAVKAVSLPTIEVHITDLDKREPFRKISYIRAACIGTISGHGTDGYIEAMDMLIERNSSK